MTFSIPKHGQWTEVLLPIVTQQFNLYILHKEAVLPLHLEFIQPPALSKMKDPQGMILLGWISDVENIISNVKLSSEDIHVYWNWTF